MREEDEDERDQYLLAYIAQRVRDADVIDNKKKIENCNIIIW